MAEWEKLTTTTIRDYIVGIEKELANRNRIFNLLVDPETRERNRKYWEEERRKKEAIEAAKSPAQKRRERQAACSHEFVKRKRRWVCKHCKLNTSAAFVAGYLDGFTKGESSVECDC